MHWDSGTIGKRLDWGHADLGLAWLWLLAGDLVRSPSSLSFGFFLVKEG